MAVAAVEALKKFVKDSEIKIRGDLILNKLWEFIANADDDALKRNGWIVNCSMETVKFHVYNSNDWIRLIPAHTVDAQPDETVEVHGGCFQKKQENMVVLRENRGTAYNVKKNYLHFWTGSAMIRQVSSMEHFRNHYHDPRELLEKYWTKSRQKSRMRPRSRSKM